MAKAKWAAVRKGEAEEAHVEGLERWGASRGSSRRRGRVSAKEAR